MYKGVLSCVLSLLDLQLEDEDAIIRRRQYTFCQWLKMTS